MESRKDRLPKGLSYPLKPSSLEAAIADSGLLLPVSLTRWDYGDEAFKASFYPKGSFPDELCFWVRCRAVPSGRVSELRAVLETNAIPAFIRWAKEIEALDVKSPRRREHQHFSWAYPKQED